MLLAAAVVALPLGLVACGGDNGSSEDEDQITAAIERAATSGDPAACTEVQTAKFTQQTSGEPSQSAAAAVKSCQRDASDTAADKVEVTDIEVDGDSATAKAEATGSVFDGQTLDIALVKEGDQWKLDEFKGFEDFDRFLAPMGAAPATPWVPSFDVVPLSVWEDEDHIYVEADLPEVIEAKLAVLDDLRQRHGIERSAGHVVTVADALDLEQVRAAAASLDRREPLVVLCEGLVLYLSREETERLATNVRRLLGEFAGLR